MKILDIHTHKPAPRPDALVCVSPMEYHPVEGQLYSVGIHPWETNSEIDEVVWKVFEEVCRDPQVVAIGECGVDLVKGGPLFRQMQVMKRQIDLSEELGKPLVIHDVHAHDIIIGLRKDIRPEQQWMVHGFRGKPTVASMLSDAGLYISFGEKHNDASVPVVPDELILAETDESEMPIEDIIRNLSCLRGEDIMLKITSNAGRFLNMP